MHCGATEGSNGQHEAYRIRNGIAHSLRRLWPIPFRRRARRRFDLRHEALIELGDERRKIFHDLLPPIGAADRKLTGELDTMDGPAHSATRDRQVQRRLEALPVEQPFYLHEYHDRIAPGADVEFEFHREISRRAAPQGGGPGLAAAI